MAADARTRISRATKVAIGKVLRDAKRATARSGRNAFRNRSVLSSGMGIITAGSIARGAGRAILRSVNRNAIQAAARIAGPVSSAISRATRAFMAETGRRSASGRAAVSRFLAGGGSRMNSAKLAGGFTGG